MTAKPTSTTPAATPIATDTWQYYEMSLKPRVIYESEDEAAPATTRSPSLRSIRLPQQQSVACPSARSSWQLHSGHFSLMASLYGIADGARAAAGG